MKYKSSAIARYAWRISLLIIQAYGASQQFFLSKFKNSCQSRREFTFKIFSEKSSILIIIFLARDLFSGVELFDSMGDRYMSTNVMKYKSSAICRHARCGSALDVLLCGALQKCFYKISQMWANWV